MVSVLSAGPVLQPRGDRGVDVLRAGFGMFAPQLLPQHVLPDLVEFEGGAEPISDLGLGHPRILLSPLDPTRDVSRFSGPACRLGDDPLVGHNGLVDETTAETVEAIASRVRPVLETDPRVRFAYLFGSQASGDARPDSDVDLAVSLRPQGSLLDDARLHDQLAAALGRDDVDLLVLEDAPLWLQFRVVAGRVLFSRDEQERITFRERVEKEFLDFRYYHDGYLAAVRDRARRGVLSGA